MCSTQKILRTFLLMTCFFIHMSFTDFVDETKIKAALLFKFPLFVNWPENTFTHDNTFYISLLGNCPVINAVYTIKKKMIKGKPVIFNHYEKIEDISHCHILFVCPTSLEKLSIINQKFKNKPVLLVGNQKSFAEQCGIINFKVVGKIPQYNDKKFIFFE